MTGNGNLTHTTHKNGDDWGWFMALFLPHCTIYWSVAKRKNCWISWNLNWYRGDMLCIYFVYQENLGRCNIDRRSSWAISGTFKKKKLLYHIILEHLTICDKVMLLRSTLRYYPAENLRAISDCTAPLFLCVGLQKCHCCPCSLARELDIQKYISIYSPILRTSWYNGIWWYCKMGFL